MFNLPRHLFLIVITLSFTTLWSLALATEPPPNIAATAITAMTPGYEDTSVRLIRLTDGGEGSIDILGFVHAQEPVYLRLECNNSGWLIHSLGFNAAEINARLVVTPSSYGPEFISIYDHPAADQSAYAYYIAQTEQQPLLACGAGSNVNKVKLVRNSGNADDPTLYLEFPDWPQQGPYHYFQPQCLGLIQSLGLDENNRAKIAAEVDIDPTSNVLPLPCRRGVPVIPPVILADFAPYCLGTTPYAATVRAIIGTMGHTCASYNDENKSKALTLALQNLTTLILANANIADLRPLAALTKLKILVLQGNQIQDLSPLAYLTQIEELSLNSNQIRDVSPLLPLMKLQFLNLSHNRLDTCEDWQQLAKRLPWGVPKDHSPVNCPN